MNWTLLQNSLLVAGVTSALALVLGFVAALWLASLEARGRSVFLVAAVVALALPPFLVVNCWLHLLGETGAWRAWLPLNVYSLGGTVWILTLMLWPITLFATWAAWHRLEPSQLECDPAVTGGALVRGLLLPVARGELGLAAVLTFVLALNNFAVPTILQVKVFPAEMWVRFNTPFDTLGTLRLSWPLVAAPLLLLLWVARRHVAWPRIEGPVPANVFRRQLGAVWFAGSGALAFALFMLAVAVPLAQIASVHRTWTELPGALAAGQAAVWNSLRFAAVAATFVAGAGLLAAVGRKNADCRMQKRSRPFRLLHSAFCLCAWLPFLLPGVLLGIGLIVLFNRPGLALLYQSAAIVILAFVIPLPGVGLERRGPRAGTGWTAI